MDITGKGDQQGNRHSILGILDHGSRMALALIPLRDRRSLTLLRWLIATIKTYGKPKVIRTDNEACGSVLTYVQILGLRKRSWYEGDRQYQPCVP